MRMEVVFVVNTLPFASAVCLVVDDWTPDWLVWGSTGVPQAVTFCAVTHCSKHAIVLREKYFQGRGMQSCFLRAAAPNNGPRPAKQSAVLGTTLV